MMRKKDVAVIVVTALATAAVAVALWSPMPEAVADPAGKVKALPTLTSDGVKLTLELDKAAYKAGEKPTLKLKAVNTTDSPAKLTATVTMSSMSPVSPMSRMMPMPRPLWTEPCNVTLKPSETWTFELAAGAAVGAGSSVSFTIKAGKGAIFAAGFAVPGPMLSGKQVSPSKVALSQVLGRTR